MPNLIWRTDISHLLDWQLFLLPYLWLFVLSAEAISSIPLDFPEFLWPDHLKRRETFARDNYQPLQRRVPITRHKYRRSRARLISSNRLHSTCICQLIFVPVIAAGALV